MFYITELLTKIKNQQKYAFFSTLLFGIISQGMGLFNKFSSHDDVLYLMNGGNPLPYGRWMLYILRRTERLFYGDGNYSLPNFNGIISILCVAATLCLVIDLLDIRSTILCTLLGGIVISVPCVTSLFLHMYTAHFYSYALLLSVLGPYLIMKKEKRFFLIIGIGLMVCSTAIYQAYIPVMLSVFLVGMIRITVESNGREQLILIFKKAVIIIFSCLAFISIYFIFTKVINHYYGIDLTEYKGVNQIEELSLITYLQRIRIAYKEFIFPSRNTIYDIFPGNIYFLNYDFILLSVLLFGKLLYSKRKDPLRFMILLVLVLLLPLALNFIFVMAASYNSTTLTVYGKVMFFVIFAWILEKTSGAICSVSARLMKTACYACLGLLVLMYCRFDNVCYLRMTLSQTEAIRYFSTLVTRIQSTEGYDSWKYVSFVGSPSSKKYDNSIYDIPELEHIVIPPVYGMTSMVKSWSWKEFMRIWCGYAPHEVSPSYFSSNPEVKAMPHYPAEGSIRVIDDTVVIKF